MRNEIKKFIFGIAFLLIGFCEVAFGWLEKQGVNIRKSIEIL